MHSEETKRKMSNSHKGKKHSDETKKKIGEAGKGRVVSDITKSKLRIAMLKYYETHDSPNKENKFSEEAKIKISEANKGREFSEKTKIKMSLAHMGHVPWNKGLKTGPLSKKHKLNISEANKGRKLSIEAKTNKRLARIKEIKSKYGQIMPNYNPKACKLFDKLNKENGWNLLHAENGGEFRVPKLGYFVDAIDFKNKIIIEYDEKQHFNSNGNLKEKDIERQREIMELYPDFEFKRIKEVKANEL